MAAATSRARARRRPAGLQGRIAVIGAGVAGCGVAALLRQGGWSGPLSLWESGRGPGGRASSRRSRQDPALCLDHGAPLLSIVAAPAPRLLEPLLQAGVIAPWCGLIRGLDGEGQLQQASASRFCQGSLYRGVGGMDRLCRGLLTLAQATADGSEPAGRGLEPDGHGAVEGHYGVLVRDLQPLAGQGWRLLGRDGTALAEVDWLLLSSTLLAHPRSRLLLDWPEVPLLEAARRCGDPQLDHALAAIASLRSEPRSNLLLVADGAVAAAWRALPFRLLEFDAAAAQRWGLRRVSIQPFAADRCGLVAHSTATFAAEHLSVYGSRSAIAALLGAPPRPEQEAAVIAALQDALGRALSRWISPEQIAAASAQLMRWGAALPLPPGLPEPLAFCPASRIGFCGDYVELPGFGRIEGALRSAEALAQALLGAAAR